MGIVESTILWELMELEAVKAYYLDRPKEGFKAEKAGILISAGMMRDPTCLKTERYTVWFGPGIANWNFKTLKQAEAKVAEIISKAKVPIEPRVVKRNG